MRQRRNSELHFVQDEHEDVIDRGLIAIAGERHIPFQVAVFRLQLIEQGDIVGHGDGETRPQLAEIIEQIERIGAVAEDVGIELQMQLPAGGTLLRNHRRFHFRRRLACRRGRRNEPPQIIQDCIANDGVGAIRRFDQGANIVLGGESHRDQFLGRLDFALADQFEGGFEFVRKGGDFVEAEHRARALDGVQRAESRIDQFSVIRALAEIQQRRLQSFEKLTGFLAKDLCRSIVVMTAPAC